MNVQSRWTNFVENFLAPRRRATTLVARKARPKLENLEDRLVLDRTLIDMAHVHIEPRVVNGAWVVMLNDTTDGEVRYNPDDALLNVNTNTIESQPASWDFIGAGNGNPYWHLTQSVLGDRLTMALDTADMPSGMFDTYTPNDPRIPNAGEWIKVELRDFSGPGEFSAWQNSQPPSGWWISTVDGGRTYDPALYIEPGGHNHYNFGFTAPGTYDATFEVSAFLMGGHGLPFRSDPFTLEFNVEDPGSNPNGKPPAWVNAHIVPGSVQTPVFLSQGLGTIPISQTVSPLEATSASADQVNPVQGRQSSSFDFAHVRQVTVASQLSDPLGGVIGATDVFLG